jgi:hypothetical protein
VGPASASSSPDSVAIEIRDGTKRLKQEIYPFFLIRYAPSITCEGRLLAELGQPYTEKIIHFISPPFRYCSDYRVEVSSPKEKFPDQDRRLKIEVNIGEGMDYILIGRDWQEAFQLIFEADKMIIKER